MLAVTPRWELNVERGPDWLFVRVESSDELDRQKPPLADELWGLMQQHFAHRLVLELDKIPLLNSLLIGQLIDLYRRIRGVDGVMRLCGLSTYNRRVLHTCRLDERLTPFHDRHEAVSGNFRPVQPR